MNRREFLTHSGAGAAAAALGAVAGRAELERYEPGRERDRREAEDYAGDSRGSQRIWWSLETEQPVVALTFDDGPHPELTPRVLAALAAHDVRATFFMIGENAEARRSLVADVLAAGHEIGNHTWSHGRVVQMDRSALDADIARGARALRSITGRPTRWFRPPGGMVTGDMLAGAAAVDQELVLWSMTRGGPDVVGSAAVLAHLNGTLHPGAIIDLHDGTDVRPTNVKLLRRRHEEIAVLPSFLAHTLAAGFRFVSVSELLSTATAPARPVHPAR